MEQQQTSAKRSFMSLKLTQQEPAPTTVVELSRSGSREDSIGTRSCHDHGEIDDEYYSLDNGLGDDWDPNAKLEPLIPLKFTSTADSVYAYANASNSSLHSTPACSGCERELSHSQLTIFSANSDSEVDEPDEKSAAAATKGGSAGGGLSSEGLELFFNSFMDSELEGEVTVCQWLSSLSELSSEFSEKELYRLFNHIDEERTGFVDSVDFINFLSESAPDDDADSEADEVSRLRAKLNAAIRAHPFMLNFQ